MKSSSTIGGKGTAKRRILIREYIANTYFEKKKKSNPFESDNSDVDDSEWNISPFKLKTKPYKLFEKEENNEEEDNLDGNQIKDDILSEQPNLVEADKFLASIKLPSKNKNSKKENIKLPNSLDNYLDIKLPETLELFKKESQKLDKLRSDEINGISSDDEFLI